MDMSKKRKKKKEKKKKKNVVDQCIYLRISESRYIFLMLRVDYIFFTANDSVLLLETKRMLSSHQNLGEASYV
jgi:hypothetical protein